MSGASNPANCYDDSGVACPGQYNPGISLRRRQQATLAGLECRPLFIEL